MFATMEEERACIDPRLVELDFVSTGYSSLFPKSKNKTLKDRVGNPCWRTSLFFPQTIVLSLEMTSNVTYVYFEDFAVGCDLEFFVGESETGPYTRVVRRKFFPRASLRRVKIGSLPCKFLKIVVHSGLQIHPATIHLFGFHAQDAEEVFGDNLFELLVTNSKRLIYS